MNCNFWFSFILDYSDCHATLNEQLGDVISYGYPQGYYNRMDCTWLIQRPFGEIIKMEFMHFNIEPDFNNVICK